MKTTPRPLTKLPLFGAVAVLAIFSIQAAVLDSINPPTATATMSSLLSISPNIGSTNGGQLVTITGEDLPLTNPHWTQISSSLLRTCALDTAGQIFCWGADGLMGGDRSLRSFSGGGAWWSSIPVAVDMTGALADRTIVQVSTGAAHACALDSEGLAFCWGDGGHGQLGNDIYYYSDTPVAVDTSGVLDGRTLTQISTAYHHTCAIDSEGLAFCWGHGWMGELGNGLSWEDGFWSSGAPVAVDTSGVLDGLTLTQISSGGNHTCAIDSAGLAFCWGFGSLGGLGNGLSLEDNFLHSDIPVAVDTSGVLDGRTLTQISAGGHYTCAIDSEGLAFCWGFGDTGQLGNGLSGEDSFEYSSIPVAVDTSGVLADRTLTQISSVVMHTCAVDTEGLAFCWGYGDPGQLGNGLSWEDGFWGSSVPVAANMSGALNNRTLTQVASGGLHTCAIDSAGLAFCWGSGSDGQLGNGLSWGDGFFGSSVPVPVYMSHILSTSQISAIHLGTAPCINVNTLSSTTLTCITTAHPAGIVDLVVTLSDNNTPINITTLTLPQAYTFVESSLPGTTPDSTPNVPNTGHFRVAS